MNNLKLVFADKNSVIIKYITSDGNVDMFIEKPYQASKDEWRMLRDGILKDRNAFINFINSWNKYAVTLKYHASTTSFKGQRLEGLIEFNVIKDGYGAITISLYKEEHGQKFVDIINQIIANDALWNHTDDM